MAELAMTGFRAMVVDDDELSRDVAISVLNKLGASEIVEFANGADAIAWADGNNGDLDLILCDLKMPEIDGLETLDGLALRTYPRVFILASGADRRIVRAAGQVASHVGQDRLRVVDKPVTVEKVQAIVDGMFAPPALPEMSINLLKTSPADCSTDMLRGLSLGQFVPYFEPKLNLASGRVDQAEAVWRWRHPRLGVLMPASFIGVSQSVGLIDDLFFGLFQQTVECCARWRASGADIGVSINIPPQILMSRDLPRRLDDIVKLFGLATNQFVFEVAENEWLQERENAREVLTRLRLKGFGLAIDGFGAGFSTVKQLLDAPFNEMKLDPLILKTVPADRETIIALSSYMSIARQLEMTIVAQGIGTVEQQEYASTLGFDRLQGGYVGEAMPAELFHERFGSRHHSTL